MPSKRAGQPCRAAASRPRVKKRANETPHEEAGSDTDNGGVEAKRQKVGSKKSCVTKKSVVGDRGDSDDSDDVEEFGDEEHAGLDSGKGLNQNLPPISNVYAAFHDIAERSHGLLNDNSQIYLRVATLCSGTEAPVFALKMLQEAFDRMRPGNQFLQFSHVFSVEIDKDKQAYIARNTEGSILFNDVRDFIEPKDGKAPTAMGALEEIPGDIDLLVAGCSCVDFSTLNTRKIKSYVKDLVKNVSELMKEIKLEGYNGPRFTKIEEHFKSLLDNIDQLGESSQTFFSMLKYVKDYRPKIVILENVFGAPWDDTAKVWFPFVKYKASYVSTDTKNFYIPQTRLRRYLIALNKDVFPEKTADDIIHRWSDLMENGLVRSASTPVNSWLLPSAHPLTERARQDDSEKALHPRPKFGWERSKARHARVRDTEGLGGDRPLTDWSLTQLGQPYDRIDRLVMLTQSKRVLDCIDINHLRALKSGYDSRFKNHIHNLSQNIDRISISVPLGITGCITPRCIPWVTDQCRILSGYEALGLQGLPLNRLRFATETQDILRSLAGNAMSMTVVGTAIIAILRAIKEIRHFLNDTFPLPADMTQVEAKRRVTDSTLEEYPNFDTSHKRQFDQSLLLDLFERSRRYCFCNGSAKYSTDDFLKCTKCSTVRCKWCAGKPSHSFAPTKRPSNFLLLDEVEQEVVQFLPTKIVNLITAEYEVTDEAITAFPAVMKHLKETILYYHSMHITEVVTICYADQNGLQARAVLTETGITWYLYLDA
ncbi:S-adenosyl-L-methionine-dependent methyltransferase [Daldinia sp. FL1419]|nr:S-adenosyl-L-methionine-dependent methyltransferase [Daldinia sp. FL1419]